MVELGGWTGPAECGYPACWRSVRTRWLCTDARIRSWGARRIAPSPQVREPVPEPDQPGLFNLAKPIDRRH